MWSKRSTFERHNIKWWNALKRIWKVVLSDVSNVSEGTKAWRCCCCCSLSKGRVVRQSYPPARRDVEIKLPLWGLSRGRKLSGWWGSLCSWTGARCQAENWNKRDKCSTCSLMRFLVPGSELLAVSPSLCQSWTAPRWRRTAVDYGEEHRQHLKQILSLLMWFV